MYRSKGEGEEKDAGDHTWHKSRPGKRKRMQSLRGACVAAGGEEEQAEPASRRCVASARGAGAEEEEEEETDVVRWKFLRGRGRGGHPIGRAGIGRLG